MKNLIANLEAAVPILRMACERGIPEASDALEKVSAALAEVRKCYPSS